MSRPGAFHIAHLGDDPKERQVGWEDAGGSVPQWIPSARDRVPQGSCVPHKLHQLLFPSPPSSRLIPVGKGARSSTAPSSHPLSLLPALVCSQRPCFGTLRRLLRGERHRQSWGKQVVAQMHRLLRSAAEALVLFSSAAFFLTASQKEAGFKGHLHPCHRLRSSSSLAASKEKCLLGSTHLDIVEVTKGA